MKISVKQGVGFVLLLSIVLYAEFFQSFIPIYPNAVRGFVPAAWIVLSFILIIDLRKKTVSFSRGQGLVWLEWTAMILLLLIGNSTQENAFWVTLRTLSLMILCMTLCMVKMPEMRFLPWMVAGVGYIHVLATLFLFLVPSAYSFVERAYGYVPSGTNNGAMGYRAGITFHYSLNGLLIILVVLVLGAFIAADVVFKKRRRLFLWILFAAAGFALILTAKRGPLLCGVLCFIGLYFLCYPNKIFRTSVKLLLVGALIAVILFILVPRIPVLNAVYQRFTTVGDDAESHGRLKMWEFAWQMFKQRPILGYGWDSFTVYFKKTGIYVGNLPHAHNVYLQLLAERGIVGLLCFLAAVLTPFFRTVSLLVKRQTKNLSYDATVFLFLSFLFQVFFILYSATDGTLYGVAFYFYPLFVSLTYAVSNSSEMTNRGLQHA